jgi:hypothetical protein
MKKRIKPLLGIFMPSSLPSPDDFRYTEGDAI